ncbi:thiol-disulfide oxidoreductase DCC family protein [Chitinophaga caseinilytica]|uniref:thiol-disulfide oxidoreductase DCC family protein n=1 Tax=Chitinophaga caseinilytica TaxID=2267521 RepID=UPI003C2B90F6
MHDKAVILFDGVCRFCNGSVNFVIRHDRRDRFRFAPLQSEAGQSLLQAHGIDAGETDSFVLIRDGKSWVKSSAALRVARGLGFPWNLLWAFIIVPRFLRDAVYDWIARNRYRWFGKMDVCMVPDVRVRGKFL